MSLKHQNRRKKAWLVFWFSLCLSLALAVGFQFAQPLPAFAQTEPPAPGDRYVGSEFCKTCHEQVHTPWLGTRHAQAFSSPIFQRDWAELHNQSNCLSCHTTGYDPKTGVYAEAGVTCESCHGAFNPNHPAQNMPVTPDAELCATCHKPTTDEWKASPHLKAGIQCQNCHDPHSQTPKAASVTELCTNCHKEMGSSFTHGTHANAGLQCSNCHMYTAPRESDPIEGLVPTGHTFMVGSDACIGCHQDTVHTRDKIVALTGEVQTAREVNVEELKKQLLEQEEAISSLKNTASVRLYTGLAQGAIVGLSVGIAAAWIVSRRITIVEEADE